MEALDPMTASLNRSELTPRPVSARIGAEVGMRVLAALVLAGCTTVNNYWVNDGGNTDGASNGDLAQQDSTSADFTTAADLVQLRDMIPPCRMDTLGATEAVAGCQQWQTCALDGNGSPGCIYCGFPGQPCCQIGRPDQCGGGQVCRMVNNVRQCGGCGLGGEACCTASMTAACVNQGIPGGAEENCDGVMCYYCGGIGEPCCPNSMCNNGSCANGKCQ